MNRHRIARILLVAGMAITPLASADGGIVKCIGPSGHVTLTDGPCQSGERSVTLVPGALQAAPAPAVTRSAVAQRLSGGAAVRVPLRRLDPPSRSLRRDVITLKAARQALMLMDGAADSIASRQVAGLR